MKIIQIIDLCQKFFKEHNGYIEKAYFHEFYVYENSLKVLTIFVRLSNINIFGNGYFHAGVFERYRKLQNMLYSYLSKNGFPRQRDIFEIPIIPLLDKEVIAGQMIELSEHDQDLSSPLEVINLEKNKLRDNLAIFKNWPEVNWGLRRVSDGRVYYLGESDYSAYVATFEALKNVKRVVDLGVGSGNTIRIALSRYCLDYVLLNDFDEAVCKALENSIRDQCFAKNVSYEMNCGDCLDISLPPRIDLLDISTNKDILLSFLKLKKEEIQKNLNPHGIIEAQIGSVATPFWLALIAELIPDMREWPWMKYIIPLHQVTKFYKLIKVGAEVVAIGSDDSNSLNKVFIEMRKLGDAEEYNPFLEEDIVYDIGEIRAC